MTLLSFKRTVELSNLVLSKDVESGMYEINKTRWDDFEYGELITQEQVNECFRKYNRVSQFDEYLELERANFTV
ncbi:hypothetical protein [Halobacillus litoralis]|uniref:hypothetical protein n=1 Tax=Halobacillus litoralis TaxID=45668 RepID=UPI001CD7827C|nr:hypothetical protein [Halobacillus litoralis]MCA1021555.1 hypothetical protein [Halobacillus litoralis]